MKEQNQPNVFFDYIEKMKDYYFVFNGLIFNKSIDEFEEAELALTTCKEIVNRIKETDDFYQKNKENLKDLPDEEMNKILYRLDNIYTLTGDIIKGIPVEYSYIDNNEKFLKTKTVYDLENTKNPRILEATSLFYPIHKDDIQDIIKGLSEVSKDDHFLLGFSTQSDPENTNEDEISKNDRIVLRIDGESCRKLINDYALLKSKGYLL